MVSSGAIGRAEDECQRRAADAETYLATIEDTEAKQTLAEMCSFLVERVF
jgi:geranylgeranyl pyrophosphate synthase